MLRSPSFQSSFSIVNIDSISAFRHHVFFSQSSFMCVKCISAGLATQYVNWVPSSFDIIPSELMWLRAAKEYMKHAGSW